MENFLRYKNEIGEKISEINDKEVLMLIEYINKTADAKGTIYLCGNGGSLANSMHIANDLQFNENEYKALKVNAEALGSNNAYVSCIANDKGYENIFSEQIKQKGVINDMLLVLSGSGNSRNIINAINAAHEKGMKTIGLIGYDGGECKNILDFTVHIKSYDMQICEDIQLIIMHMAIQTMKKYQRKQ